MGTAIIGMRVHRPALMSSLSALFNRMIEIEALASSAISNAELEMQGDTAIYWSVLNWFFTTESDLQTMQVQASVLVFSIRDHAEDT